MPSHRALGLQHMNLTKRHKYSAHSKKKHNPKICCLLPYGPETILYLTKLSYSNILLLCSIFFDGLLLYAFLFHKWNQFYPHICSLIK